MGDGMSSHHCADCQCPVRVVRVWGWDNVKDGTVTITLDYVKSPDGAYAVVGPDTAKFIETDKRAAFGGPLYTDHRRTCSKVKEQPKQPPTIEMACDACGAPNFLTLKFGESIQSKKCEACGGPCMFVGILSEAS